METNGIGKYTISFGMSLAITSIVSALLVLLKESSQTVLAFMKQLTFHHWVTHSLLVLLLFVALGWILGRSNGGQGIKMSVNGLVGTLVGSVVLSGLIIAGFYLIGD